MIPIWFVIFIGVFMSLGIFSVAINTYVSVNAVYTIINEYRLAKYAYIVVWVTVWIFSVSFIVGYMTGPRVV